MANKCDTTFLFAEKVQNQMCESLREAPNLRNASATWNGSPAIVGHNNNPMWQPREVLAMIPAGAAPTAHTPNSSGVISSTGPRHWILAFTFKKVTTYTNSISSIFLWQWTFLIKFDWTLGLETIKNNRFQMPCPVPQCTNKPLLGRAAESCPVEMARICGSAHGNPYLSKAAE